MRLEMIRQLTRAVRFAFAQLDAQLLQRARHSRLLEQRATRGEQHAQLAARQPLERLDALARDLHVRLGFAESFARRIERDRRVGRASVSRSASQRSASPTPSVADDEESRGQPARERRDHRGVGGPWKTAGDQPLRRATAAC